MRLVFSTCRRNTTLAAPKKHHTYPFPAYQSPLRYAKTLSVLPPLFLSQEENAKLCDVFMRWLLGEAGVRFQRRRDYEVSESRRVPNTESLADRLRCCLQVCPSPCFR